MKKQKTYAVLNLIVVILVIAWNGLSNSGIIGGKTVGNVSYDLYNLFTPAGYAFAIWGIIFLGLIANGIYQVAVAFGSNEEDKKNVLTGPWLILANLANGVWIWFWLNEYIGVSVLIMIVLLLCLIKVAIDLRLENHGPKRAVIILGWWPNTIYLGWISVALIANVAAYLSQIGWADGVNEVIYTIIMIIVAAVLNLFMLYARNMREFCLVGIWALMAIAARSEIESIYYTAVISSAVIALLTLIHGVMNLKENTLIFPKKVD
ncbi:MAG: tryptophan-rich sensory protein [Crocinitomicaceae bacterium]|nr:tryptophan-rich sensory protein [Crocinitomicaceae bacterium]